MKRYNKINARWVILGIVCPILAFLFSMNVTYAYFTATAKHSNGINKTGLIKILFDPITKQLNTTTISDTATVYPGDTLNINGSLVNGGHNDCYAILEFEVYVQKYGASTKETAIHKYYAYEGSTLKEITGTTGSYSTYASIISSTSGSNKKSFNLSYKFTGEKYDNSYKKATVTYAVYGYAIQTANISQTKATEELLDTAGYKYLTVYGNSVQNGTPSPANPVEIQSVGEKTKNLFDGYWEIGALSTTNGSNLPSSSSLRSNYIQLNPNTNYYITLPAGSNYYPFLYNTNKQFSRYLGLRVGSFSFTTSSSEYYFKIMQYNSTSLPTKIQLEEGSTATEYEPYGYKIPINIKSKNLGDIPSTTVSGTSTWTAQLIGDFNLPSGTYTLSCNFIQNGTEMSTVAISAREYKNTSVYYGTATSINKNSSLALKFTIPADKSGCRIYFYSNQTGTSKTTSCDFSNIQVEKGETATEYEPYVEPSTTYVYLDEPLRKVGDYADYIDLQTGTLVRQIRHLELAVADMNNSDAYPGWSNDTTAILNSDYPNQNNQLNYITTIATNVHPDSKGIGINTLNSNKILFLDKGTFNLTQTEWIANYPDLVFKLDYGLQTPETTTIDVPDLGQFSGSVIEIGTTVQPSSTISSNETQLPSEYQELDYITMQNNSSNGYSNGILTDITFANSDRIEMAFSSTDTSNSMMLVSAYTTTSTNPYIALNTSGYTMPSFTSITANTTITRAQASDGSVRTLSFDYTATSTNKIYFGAWSDAAWSRTITWYSFKILKRGSIIANFVPCYRKSDNAIGMYDTVSGTFYTNAGTGTFLKGNNV